MSIIRSIKDLGLEARDPHLDGYSQLCLKQRLQEIHKTVEQELALCSDFTIDDPDSEIGK
jgi:hypothetical protein